MTETLLQATGVRWCGPGCDDLTKYLMWVRKLRDNGISFGVDVTGTEQRIHDLDLLLARGPKGRGT